MLQDRLKKKVKRPNGNDSSLGTNDISEKVPSVDNILDEVDKALKVANHLIETVVPQERCGC